MKKIAICVLLLFLTVTAGIFAEHPDGIGIGPDFRYGVTGGWGPVLSLKLPVVPVYWGIGLGIDRNWFGISVSGDYYFIDKTLVPQINLGWYLGVGGYVGMWIWQDHYYPVWANNNGSDMSLTLGARLPIGLSWQPLDFLEVFVEVAPSLGLWLIPVRFPAWDVNFDLGLRFWI